MIRQLILGMILGVAFGSLAVQLVNWHHRRHTTVDMRELIRANNQIILEMKERSRD